VALVSGVIIHRGGVLVPQPDSLQAPFFSPAQNSCIGWRLVGARLKFGTMIRPHEPAARCADCLRVTALLAL
jgi:hypothetical protein